MAGQRAHLWSLFHWGYLLCVPSRSFRSDGGVRICACSLQSSSSDLCRNFVQEGSSDVFISEVSIFLFSALFTEAWQDHR